MNEIIESRKNEIKIFLEYYKNNSSLQKYEYFDYYLLYFLPFRNCENLQEEIDVFKNYFGIEIESYYGLIIFICTKYYPDFDCSWIRNFLNKYKINDFSFQKEHRNWLLGGNIKYTFDDLYECQKDIIEYFVNEEKTDSNDNIKEKIGFFSEHLVHDYLDKCDNYSNICWVSQIVGDGLGYDFIAYNNKTNKTNYIEVKGKTSTFDITLSKNETRVLNKVNKNDLNEEYLVFCVPLVFTNGAFDYDILECYIDDDKPENNRETSLITRESYLMLNSLDEQAEQDKRAEGKPYQKKINFYRGGKAW